jgi:hypothetical protein
LGFFRPWLARTPQYGLAHGATAAALVALLAVASVPGCGGGNSGNGSAGVPDASPLYAAGGDASGESESENEASDGAGGRTGDDAAATMPEPGDAASSDTRIPGDGADGSVTGDGGSTDAMELWHPTTLAFTSTGTFSNQYMQNAMTAVFTGPGGVVLKIPGYFTGGTTWAVRFSPNAVGSWTYVTQSADPGLGNKTGTLDCAPNTNPALHGPLGIDAGSHTHLQYQDGTPYFALAYESDWLGLLDLGPTDTPAAHAKLLIDTQSANGFHETLMNVFAYDTTWDKPDGIYQFGPTPAFPWGGSNTAPQQDLINPSFFDRFDAVIDYLFQNGITSHLFFLVHNKGVSWPAQGSAEDDKYFEYVTARYQAYPNMVWDIAKETFNYDEAYIQGRVALIESSDGYQRLRTTHAPINGGAPAGANYWFDVKPNNLDFYTAEAVQGTAIYANTRSSTVRVGPFPYANDENSYQVGNDGTSTYSQAKQTASSVHDDMMEVIMAGAGAGYYYAYHAWDDVRYDEVPAGIAFFKNLSSIFTSRVNLNTLAPDDVLIGGGGFGEHCLASPGQEYVVELSPAANTTKVTLDVAGLKAGSSLSATWYDLDLGGMTTTGPVTGNGTLTFTKPFPGVGILVVN